MKKLAFITMMSVAFSVFVPALPMAQAASFEETLTEVVGQSMNVERIQQLLRVKESLEGNRSELLGFIAQAALQRALSNTVGKNNGDLLTQDDRIGQIEAIARNEFEKRAGKYLKEWDKELAALSMILNHNTVSSVDESQKGVFGKE